MRRTNIVNAIKVALKQATPDVDAILFGSEARGEARPDSDIDLLILIDRDVINLTEQLRVVDSLFDIELKSGILINPVIMLKKQWGKIVTPFYENVMKEGILL